MIERLPRRVLVPLIVACALFMENLDSTVIATALPDMAQSFHARPLELSLGITSYLVALSVFLPLSGWVADRFGSRNVFRLAIIAFMLGSALCGLANNLWELVLARVLQGTGGAMMVPVGRLVLYRSVQKSELVSAMAYLTVPALVGPVLGPPLGGFIATYWSWRWIFLINIPIGLLGLVLTTLFIPDVREEMTPRLDFTGWALIATALSCLVLSFETVGRDTLPNWGVFALLAVGLGTGLLYLRHARRHPHPIMDLSLFRIATFRGSVLGGTMFRIGIGATPFLLPLMLQLGFGLSAFESGMLTLASALGALFMKATAGPIIRHFGFRRVLIINAVVSSVLLGVCALFQPGTPHWLILGALLAGGFFRSLQFTALNIIAIVDVPDPQMSQATSLSSTAQQVSLSLGVGAAALLLHFTLAIQGQDSLSASSFWPAFALLAVLAAGSALTFRSMAPDAGAEASGRGAKPALGKSAPRAA